MSVTWSEGTNSCIYYSKIRGYHVYQETWMASVGEILGTW